MTRSAAQMWCPKCEDYCACKSINPSLFGVQSGNRLFIIKHDDLKFFRRFRQCVECGDEFETAEIEAKFVHELSELRDSLAALRAQLQQVGSYFEEGIEQIRELEQELPKDDSEQSADAGLDPLA